MMAHKQTPTIFGKKMRKNGTCWDLEGCRIQDFGPAFFIHVRRHDGEWYELPGKSNEHLAARAIEREIEKMRKYAEKLGT